MNRLSFIFSAIIWMFLKEKKMAAPKRYSEFDTIGVGIPIPGEALFLFSYRGVSYRCTRNEFVGTLIPNIDKVALGLDKVDNTPDLQKPISTATAAALSSKAPTIHSHNATDIINFTVAVTSVLDSWSGTAKPTDFPLINALIGQKVNIDSMSAYALQTALDNVAANVNTKADKVHQHTPASVGLGNVDNTPDVSKPVSVPVQTELNKKVNISDLPALLAAAAPTSPTVSIPKVKQKPHITLRYMDTDNTSGVTVQYKAAHTLFTSVTWSRSGTQMSFEIDLDVLNHETISIGDHIIIYNAGEKISKVIVTALSGNVVTCSCLDIGPYSNTGTGNINYVVVFKTTLNSSSPSMLSSITVTQTTGGGDYNSQLDSVGIYLPANTLATGTLDLVLPHEIYGVAGFGNSISDINLPVFSARAGSDTLSAIGATLAVNQNSSGYSTFTIGALGATTVSKVLKFSF